ncbi:MAG: dihydroneopterin aldolase [Rickettsiales bacterium]|nr:dihydroneopterin aldolase [Rickettsiales bacterium]
MIIKIKNLHLKTVIGIHDWEKNIDREILINVEIHTNFNEALRSDKITDAIDYDHIVNKIKKLIASKNYQLVERMAQDVMDKILEDKRINKCKLEIDKVGAVEMLESFSVTIEQENK